MTKSAAASNSSRSTWLIGAAALVIAIFIGICVGAVAVPIPQAFRIIASHIPGLGIHTDAAQSTQAIIWQLRLPRVALALLVGAMLSSAGCSYQGTFRNPLADPYLLGVSAGAGLGANAAGLENTLDMTGTPMIKGGGPPVRQGNETSGK